MIKLRSIEKSYRHGLSQTFVLRRISGDIQQGEFVSIMGPSGAGKSTLLHIMGMHDSAWNGEYWLFDEPIHQLSAKDRMRLQKQHIGFVFQGFNLLSRTTALENVELPMMYARPGLSSAEQRERALRALERVGLDDRAHHHPSQLSGGQQQRVAIARALVNDPALLLADEPTGNLDSSTSIEIMGIFQSLNQRGMSIAMVTHELDIARYTQRMVVMRDGRIIRDERVMNRLAAADELNKLRQEHQAVQLTT